MDLERVNIYIAKGIELEKTIQIARGLDLEKFMLNYSESKRK